MTRRFDRAGYLAVFAIGAGAFWITLDFPPDSAIFPRLVAGTLAAMGALHLIGTFASHHDQTQAADEEASGGYQLVGGTGFFDAPVRFAVIFLLSLLYCLAIPMVGYYTSTIVFVPLSLIALGYRRPLGVIAATLLYAGGTWLLISVIFARVLPRERLLQLFG